MPVGADRLRLVAAAAIARCAGLQVHIEAPVGATGRCTVVSVAGVAGVRLTSSGRCGLVAEMLALFAKEERSVQTSTKICTSNTFKWVSDLILWESKHTAMRTSVIAFSRGAAESARWRMRLLLATATHY